MRTLLSIATSFALLSPSSASLPVRGPARAPTGWGQEVIWPETPQGEIAAAFVATFGTQDPETARLFEEACRAESVSTPLDERVALFLRIGDQLGELEVLELRSVTPVRYTIAVQPEFTDGGYLLELLFEEEAPHALLGQRFSVLSPVRERYDDWDDLNALVAHIRADALAPGMAAAVIGPKDGGASLDVGVSGRRAAGRDGAIEPGDRFHIGSVTKSVTALAIGTLIEDGVLDWNSTVGELLPACPQDNPFAATTLQELLWHRSGLVAATYFNGPEMARLAGLPGTPTEQRTAWTNELVRNAPANTDGSYLYSNAGYTVAACLAEHASGQSWEELVRQRVLEPLQLASAVQGPPHGTDAAAPLEAASGHAVSALGVTVVPPEQIDLGAFLAPAGELSFSVEDLARYAAYHLRGLTDAKSPQASLVQHLHTPYPEPAAGEPRYACGWIVAKDERGKPVHWHNGTTGSYYAFVALLPADRRAVVVLLNTMQWGEEAAWAVVRSVVERGSW